MVKKPREQGKVVDFLRAALKITPLVYIGADYGQSCSASQLSASRQ